MYLQLVASDIATLQRNQSDIVAKTEQYKRNQLLLGHRILRVRLVHNYICGLLHFGQQCGRQVRLTWYDMPPTASNPDL